VSSPTWTPAAVTSEAQALRCRVWRMVEAQHLAATAKLVETRAEQELLEEILEASKPPIPAEAAGLDYLLFSPFRYDTRPPSGSRFRAPTDPGVFYGAELPRTAAAEVAHWRFRFLRDCAGLDRLQPATFTAFSVSVATRAIDLRRPPFDRDEQAWRHPHDYGATQALARTVREAMIGAILYLSVRDPEPHFCAALLTPRAFAAKRPAAVTQTWILTLTNKEAIWLRGAEESLVFATAPWGYG